MTHASALRGRWRRPAAPARDAVPARHLAVWVGVGLAATAAVLALGPASPAPAWLACLLVASVVLPEIHPIRIGRVQYAASDFGTWLAIVLLGPWPALLVASAGTLAGGLRRRIPRQLLLVNLACSALVVANGSAILALFESFGSAQGGALLPVAVMVIALANSSLNLAAMTVGSPWMKGVTLRSAFSTHMVPVLPWMLLTAVVAAGAVHADHAIGPGAVAAAILVHAAAQVMLKTLERDEDRAARLAAALAERDRYMADALEAEARERRRLAMALHDDALQTLLAAGQDLTAAQHERAASHLAHGVSQLREIATLQYSLEAAGSGLRGRLEAMLELVAQPRGLAVTVAVEGDVPPELEDLAVALVRELAVNAVKHSGGTRVDVSVRAGEESVELAVQDDGAGFDLARERGGSGLGLAIVQDRVQARGGSLTAGPGATGGCLVRATLPRAR